MTWNVNSLRVRLPHLLEYLADSPADVIGLQETKLIDEKFPKAEIESAGYHVIFAGQPTYNGVAILAKQTVFDAPTDVQINNPLFADEQVRIIAATLRPKAGLPRPVGPRNDGSIHSTIAPSSRGGEAAEAIHDSSNTPSSRIGEAAEAIHDSNNSSSSQGGVAAEAIHNNSELRFINAYVPNGSEVGSDKYDYKLRWLDAFALFIKEQLSRYPLLTVVGDFNIAPQDADVHDPKAWEEQVLCSAEERKRFEALLALGLHDAFRLFDQPQGLYSWWDYRQMAFRRNRGLRIDHLLLSQGLRDRCTASGIDTAPRKKEQPSDHAPAWAEID